MRLTSRFVEHSELKGKMDKLLDGTLWTRHRLVIGAGSKTRASEVSRQVVLSVDGT